MQNIIFKKNASNAAQITGHFQNCDPDFYHTLSSKMDINNYAAKLENKALRFEAWDGDNLVALAAIYINENDFSFITDISVSKTHTERGLASRLMQQAIEAAKSLHSTGLKLEVAKNNAAALNFYRKFEFISYDENDTSFFLSLTWDHQ